MTAAVYGETPQVEAKEARPVISPDSPQDGRPEDSRLADSLPAGMGDNRTIRRIAATGEDVLTPDHRQRIAVAREAYERARAAAMREVQTEAAQRLTERTAAERREYLESILAAVEDDDPERRALQREVAEFLDVDRVRVTQLVTEARGLDEED